LIGQNIVSGQKFFVFLPEDNGFLSVKNVFGQKSIVCSRLYGKKKAQ
jgi:hypothetical protein